MPHPLLLFLGISFIGSDNGEESWVVFLVLTVLGVGALYWWHHQLERCLKEGRGSPR